VPYRVRTDDFLCIAHRSAATCDEARVDRQGSRWVAVSFRQNIDCVLPA
jgi:hypothetical protein